MTSAAKSFVIDRVQTALNAYLALDPESRRRIAELDGKTVTLELAATGLVLNLSFADGTLQVRSGKPERTDTTITGTPLRLLHLALSREQRQQFFSDDVSIQGNLELGQLVIDLFDQLDIDWEEIASRFIGDIPAHHIGRITGKIKHWVAFARQTLTSDVSEYIHEEVDLFPPREAVSDFFHDVDALRMDTDRLEARLKLLRQHLTAKRSPT